MKSTTSQFSLKRVLVASGIVSLILIYPFLFIRVINDPLQNTAADFLPYYAAGKLSITEGFSQAYNLESLRQAEENVLLTTMQQIYEESGKAPPEQVGELISPSEVNPFPHPPFILPILFTLSHLGYLPAFVSWTSLMLIIYCISCIILLRLIPEAVGINREILFLGSLLFYPAFFSFVNGQDSAILFLGSVLWYSGLIKDRERTSGLGLGLMTIRPHIALALAVPFFFKKRKVWWWFCIGAGFLVLFSFAIIGIEGVKNYISILTLSASGIGFKFINDGFHVDLGGVLHRNLPWIGSASIRAISWACYALLIIFLSWTWTKSMLSMEQWVGVAIILTVFFVPHLNFHDLILLLIPIYACIRLLLRKGLISIDYLVIVPIALSLILFTSYFFMDPIKYTVAYLIMGTLLIGILFPEKILHHSRI